MLRPLLAILALVLAVVLACGTDPGGGGDLPPADAGGLQPDAGQVDPPRDGGELAPDGGLVDEPDAGARPDGGACVAESHDQACARLGKDCGVMSITDNCGSVRDVDCGSCVPGARCGVDTPNVCKCPVVTNEQHCQGAHAECGNINRWDGCGRPIVVDCGACPAGKACDLSNECH